MFCNELNVRFADIGNNPLVSLIIGKKSIMPLPINRNQYADMHEVHFSSGCFTVLYNFNAYQRKCGEHVSMMRKKLRICDYNHVR